MTRWYSVATRRSTRARVWLLVCWFLLPSVVAAQRVRAACDRVASASLSFGTEGGNIRPIRTTLHRDGSITRSRDTLSAPESLGRVDTTVVRALVRLAWNGGVIAHEVAAERPLAQRDMANEFIHLASPCGDRRGAYQGDAPRRFRELYALLSAVVGTPPTRGSLP